jgi:hypothetical protein
LGAIRARIARAEFLAINAVPFKAVDGRNHFPSRVDRFSESIITVVQGKTVNASAASASFSRNLSKQIPFCGWKQNRL